MFRGSIILIRAFVAACGALQTHFHGKGRGGKRHRIGIGTARSVLLTLARPPARDSPRTPREDASSILIPARPSDMASHHPAGAVGTDAEEDAFTRCPAIKDAANRYDPTREKVFWK